MESTQTESSDGVQSAPEWLTSLWRTFRENNLEKKLGYVQLRADFHVWEEEFDALVGQAKAVGIDEAEMFWKTEVDDLCARVEKERKAGNIEDAWRHFHAARRMEVYGFEAIDEKQGTHLVRTRAQKIREEALNELGGRHKATIEDLLGRNELDRDVTGDEVRTAAKILHNQYGNVHMKRNFLQRQFNQLFWLGVVGGVLFIVLSILPYLFPNDTGLLGSLVGFLEPPFSIPTTAGAADTTPTVTRAGFAVFVLLAGIIGASLFGMRSLRKESLSTKVTQTVSGLTITWARGFFGAIGAMLFYFALQTPFVVDLGDNTAPLMIVVGFTAGYSERMVTQIVKTVSSTTETSND